MKKRLLAILLAVCLVVSLAPSVLAAETAETYAEKLEELGYTFTLSGVHITEAGYYKLDGTKVETESEAQIQVTDPVNKKMAYLNGTTWSDVDKVFELEHTAWEKEAIGVYVGGEKITQSGTYHDGTVTVNLENKKITLNNATIIHTTGEMAFIENVNDPDYPQYVSASNYQGHVYDNITGVPGILVITEDQYSTIGRNSLGASNWDCFHYWMTGYTPEYKFASIALGIMADDESNAPYEDWTLELIGTNTIIVNNTFSKPMRLPASGHEYYLDSPAYGVFAEANLTITGDGSLTANVDNQWDLGNSGYMNHGNPSTAGAIWSTGNLTIAGGDISATTSTTEIETEYTVTGVNAAAAIGATGSVTITGEDTTVSATDTTNQGTAIRGTTGVTITDSATVSANSSSDIAGAAIMGGTSQWSATGVEISNGASVTATAASTSSNEQLASGTGIVGATVSISDATVDIDTQATGITANVLNVASGDVDVSVSHEDGTAIDADSGSIAVGSYNTSVDSDLIANGSVVADGEVMPKEELTEYTARIENTYYTGEDGGNRAIADLVNKQTVWLNADTSAGRDDFALGNTITIMLADGVSFTGTISGPGVCAEIVEGYNEELDGVRYTEYIYTMVVDDGESEAKVVHADGTETYYKDLNSALSGSKLTAGDTVVLLRDVTNTSNSSTSINKSITLDLNGHTITFTKNGGLSFSGSASAPVSVTITDSSDAKTGGIKNTYTSGSDTAYSTVTAARYAEVTIEAGTFDGETKATGGKLILNGGTYLNEVVAGTQWVAQYEPDTIGTTIVGENANIEGCNAYADGGILILPSQNIGGDVSKTSGTDSVTWKIVNADGEAADYEDIQAGNCKLIISGTGAMKNFDTYSDPAPWAGYTDALSDIVIEDGVTNISEEAFANMNGYNLTLGDDISSISSYAFYYATKLGTITIGKGMTVNMSSVLNTSVSTTALTVESFVVEEGNEKYSTDADGKALYYKDSDGNLCLMKASRQMNGTKYSILDGTVEIYSSSFDGILFNSVIIPSSFNDDHTFEAVTAPEGMVFGGYYTSDDSTVAQNLKIDTKNETAREAFTVYMVLGYEITYDFGNREETVVVATDKTIGECAPVVNVDGKTFKGWSETADGTSDISSMIPTGSMTVYAIWDDITGGGLFEYGNITIEDIPTQTYTGKEIKPAVFYMDNGILKQVAEEYVTYHNNINAGTATVMIAGSTATKTFEIEPAEFDPREYSWTDGTKNVSSSASVMYDGDKHSLTIADLPVGITATYTYDNVEADGVCDVKYYSFGDPASYSVKAVFDLGDNYVFATGLSNYQKSKSGSLTIKPIEVTVTIDSKTMYVGESKPDFTYSITGLNDGMELTTEPVLYTSASGRFVGNYPITGSDAVINNDTNNYKITYVEGYLTVGLKILDTSISFANQNVTYDGTEHTIEISVDGTLPDSFSVEYTLNGQPFTGAVNAGTYEIIATITSTDPAYSAIEPMTATLTIAPATLTLTAENSAMYVGDALPELTYTIDGLVGSERLLVAPTLSCEADTSVCGTYEIVISDAVATDNYIIEYVNGELTVEKKPTSDFNNDWYWYLMLLYNQHFDITATANDGGIISPAGVSKVKYGNDLLYTITPADGYTIADVLVDGKSIGAVEVYNFDNVKKNHTITAIFVKTAWENPYTDVSNEAWYYEDVEFVSENGLMIGTGDNKFSPSAIVNRAMLVTVLWRLEGSPVVDSPVDFYDVPADEWYTAAVNWAAANGIVNGYGNGIFGAMNDLTHEQIMAILNRYAVYKKWSENVSGNADDFYTNSEWAEDNVLWADLYGMFDNINSNISDLTEGADRAELAAYLRRFCERFMAE